MKKSLNLSLLAGFLATATMAAPVTWETIVGGGTDIGVGADNTVWLLGENGWLEDKPIFRRDGNVWTPIFGKAVAVSVDPFGKAWVANRDGEIFHYTGETWERMPGKALDIGVGADGTVWIIGYKSWPASWDVPPDNVEVYRWNTSSKAWDKVDGAGVRIAVDPTGRPWMVNREGEIYRRKGNNTTSGVDQWEKMPGTGTDIGIGADGTVWLIGPGNWVDNHDIYIWNGADWTIVGGTGMRIAARSDGSPWMVNVDGDIYRGTLYTLSAAAVSVVEGQSARFEVRLSSPHTEEVKVDYATASGTATSGTDFNAATGTLVFPPGSTNQVVSVVVNPDNTVEGNETFTLNLSGAVNAILRTAQVTATISDIATLSIADATATEGGTLSFAIQRLGDLNASVSVLAATASGTALSGLDFVGATNTVSFAPGETNKTFEVLSVPDSESEGTETFTVNLTEALGAAVARAQATGSITNAGAIVPPADLLGLDPANRTLAVKTTAGLNYTLEYAEVVAGTPTWKPYQAIQGTGATVTIFLVDTPGAARFFRVRIGGQ